MESFYGVDTTPISDSHPFSTRTGHLHPVHERHELTGTPASFWNVLENAGFEEVLVTDALPLDIISADRFQHGYEELDDDTVLLYWENMRNGEVFPPIVVAFTGTNYYNISGRHTAAAADLNGAKTHPAYIVHIDNEDVIQDLVIQFNLRHSNKDQAIDNGMRIQYIRQYVNQGYSVPKIAKLVNMSEKTAEKNVREQKALGKVIGYMPPAFRHRIETQRDKSANRISGEIWIPMADIVNAIDLPVEKDKFVNWICRKLEDSKYNITRESLRGLAKGMVNATSYAERSSALETYRKATDLTVQHRKVTGKKGVKGITSYSSARLVGEGLTKACQEPSQVLSSLSSLDEGLALYTHITDSKKHIANLEHLVGKWIEEKTHEVV